MKKSRVALLALVFAVAGGAALSAGSAASPIRSAPGLANRCVVLKDASDSRALVFRDQILAKRGGGSHVYLKPTGLGTYMVYAGPGRYLGRSDGRRVTLADSPGPLADWRVKKSGRSRFVISPRKGKGRLTVTGKGRLRIESARRNGRHQSFRIRGVGGCDVYPEAHLDATGHSTRTTNRDGTVFGFADSHVHITAEFRAGGQVIHGESFDRYGITRALGGDAKDHGENGELDVTGNLLRDGSPFGEHDTEGWPGFTGWPTNDTNTHQQIYYMWLKRAWKAGLRLAVAQTVEDQPICEIEPVKDHTCDETKVVKLEIRKLRGLQNYVDAQAGGKGRGWFRLVHTPKQARAAIERGKLAVVIGMETSNPFGCSERDDQPACTRRSIDRSIADLKSEGVRSVFLAHWVDNALGGPASEGGVKGAFINVFNKFQTGDYLTTRTCSAAEGEELEELGQVEIAVLSKFFPATAYLRDEPLAEYPDEPQCNSQGLTKLGAYAVRKLMDNHMLIEVDHLSPSTRKSVMRIAEKRRYPLVSGHTGTGGPWTPSLLRRLFAIGGYASATPTEAPGLSKKLVSFAKYRDRGRYFGIGLGTDVGGFASLPNGPGQTGADPLPYPVRSYDGKVTFRRQVTGQRRFDYNADGVAHYGLIPELLADVRRQPEGRRAMKTLFRSAEAYLRTWALATK